ncbi:MAG: hypothetical protein V2A64_07010 [Candidatus Omnitrophota bacterium]
MRKRWSVVLVGLLVIAFFSFARAEDKKADMSGKEMMRSGKMEMKKNRIGEMHAMMADKSLVATKDGGIVVLAGNKLLKYNKDLVLQKEVEIKTDMGGRRKKFMEKCPMLNKDMESENNTEGVIEKEQEE